MDIRCKFCGEPIDTDEFHGAERGTWQEWTAAFRQFGCKAVDAMFDGEEPAAVTQRCSEEPILNDEAMMAVEVFTDLLGDDVDGLASTLEDFC